MADEQVRADRDAAVEAIVAGKRRRARRLAAASVAAAITALVATVLATGVLQPPRSRFATPEGWLQGWPIAVVAGLASIVVLFGAARAWRVAWADSLPVSWQAGSLVPLAISLLVIGWYTVTLFNRSTVTEGRPIARRRRGREIRVDAMLLTVGTCPAATHGRDWSKAALDEWRSVAAFLQLAEELEAVGAPPDLVGRCRGAAREERRHAVVAVQLAGGSEGQSRVVLPEQVVRCRSAARPGSSARRMHLVRLGTESLWFGSVGERAAARRLRDDIEQVDAAWRPALRRVVDEERRHAELADDIVDFCRSRAGRFGRFALPPRPEAVSRP